MLLRLVNCRFHSALASLQKPATVSRLIERIQAFKTDSMSNISTSIFSKLDSKHFINPAHPLGIVKFIIWDYFKNIADLKEEIECFDHFDPIVTVEQNFDSLCFPPDHVGRSRSDSYFINKNNLLRTHMTANESEYIKKGKRAFLVAGDVYRRDEIDSTHYPVFHQLEGVRIFEDYKIRRDFPQISPFDQYFSLKYDYEKQNDYDSAALRHVTDDLYYKLNGLVRHLFGENIPIRWQTCFFPFTSPSFEIEIMYRGRWVEVCGCGVLQQSILKECGAPLNGWAFGLGLERLAMILFDIHDIRLFWSEDERFSKQFKPGKVSKFIPFSKFPATSRDISFWLNERANIDGFDQNAFFDLIRQHSNDLVENVTLIDTFKSEEGRISTCFRLTYRSFDRTLTDEEVNLIQERIRSDSSRLFNIELR